MNDLPDFQFSDLHVPPPKGTVREQRYDLNQRSLFPVIKDAVLLDPADPNSLLIKYPVTSSHRGSLLAPVSTCLPFAQPNRVLNLQDLCTGVVPFAIQSQECVRGWKNRGRKKENGSAAKESRSSSEALEDKENGPDDLEEELRLEAERAAEEMEREEEDEESEEAPSAKGKPKSKPRELDADELRPVRRDPLLPFSRLSCLPDFSYFHPRSNQQDKLEEQCRRALVYCGLSRTTHLNSALNWWYSGGPLSCMMTDEGRGLVFHPVRTLTALGVTPVKVTRKKVKVKVKGAEVEETQLQEPIYQIVHQKLSSSSSALIACRLPSECPVLKLPDPSTPSLQFCTVLKHDEIDYLSHISPSPYLPGEFLTASHSGRVCLWDVEQEGIVGGIDISEMEMRKSCRYPWIGCYFGRHPRVTGVVTPVGLALFDGRLKPGMQSKLELLKKGPEMGVFNNIVAADSYGENSSYHVALSTRELFVIDERFATTPVVRYPNQCPTPWMYFRSAQNTTESTDCIMTCSQMAQTGMCFQLDRSSKSAPLTSAAFPFCTAPPRQLTQLAIGASLDIDFSVRERLDKPLIGMSLIPHLDHSGVSLLTISALGDLFLQSFSPNALDPSSPPPETVHSFSAVDDDVTLSKKQARHLEKWIQAASEATVDKTMEKFLRVFGPGEEAKVQADLERLHAVCDEVVKRQGHPACRICNPLGVELEEETEELCSRCQMPLSFSVKHRSTDPSNRFCYIAENNTPAPVTLPPTLAAEDRFREMALTNRIAHRILTYGYNETIPTDALQPTELRMPPPPTKKARQKEVLVEQNTLRQALLDEANREGTMDLGEAEAEPEEALVGEAMFSGNLAGMEEMEVEEPVEAYEAFQPPVTSTQQDQPVASVSKKKKRQSGF